ncbi:MULTISPECIES: MerR family transcriptional regulator [unclassified Pseudoclavibacter]|uniref:MerR family transcriptional regulator n=1 Tax=unclassified Pseudoclavibacter TaxID=2615177 RepID=UPI0012F3FB9E|nr:MULTISPECIES: MerR family transcriptional regulator [unclassified Pseudoclavibacter]MBF4460849.1 MerR family transcriptional regulator [Pseudoclavibacter sp. VKM Ac-2867]VXB78623.1 MerR family transcriptional regulator [Pseudoclavibacter sp. 8L]
MRIAELAERADVKVSTVRFYERRGVLDSPPRTPGGYRDYDDRALTRLRFLRRGQELGFTLRELTDFVLLSADARAGTAQPEAVQRAANDKLLEIDSRIRDLDRTRAAIVGLLAAPCLDPTAECPIVDALGREPRPEVTRGRGAPRAS